VSSLRLLATVNSASHMAFASKTYHRRGSAWLGLHLSPSILATLRFPTWYGIALQDASIICNTQSEYFSSIHNQPSDYLGWLGPRPFIVIRIKSICSLIALSLLLNDFLTISSEEVVSSPKTASFSGENGVLCHHESRTKNPGMVTSSAAQTKIIRCRKPTPPLRKRSTLYSAVCLGAFQFGAHLALATEPVMPFHTHHFCSQIRRPQHGLHSLGILAGRHHNGRLAA